MNCASKQRTAKGAEQLQSQESVPIMDALIFWVEFVNRLFSVPWIAVHLYGHLANNICDFRLERNLISFHLIVEMILCTPRL